MTYKELFYFTGHCLALDEHPQFRESILEHIRKDDIDWDHFVQLCSDHYIIPAIYLQFKKHGLLPHLPEELTQALKAINELNRERNIQILRQIDEITAEFNKENISPVYLKGTANLLDGIYSDIGERMIGDIDFLVREEDYLMAGALLESKGYQHNEPTTYVDYTSRKHYPGLHKVGEPAQVEIHRILVSEPYSEDLQPEKVFADKKSIPGKPGIYVPSDAHKLLHTFLHDQLEDSGYSYKLADFRGMYDLLLLSRRTSVTSLANQTRYRKQAVSWLVFCQRALGLNGKFLTYEPGAAKWFCLKYDFSMKFIKTYQVWTFFKKLVYLIVYRYVVGFLKAIFLKDERRYMYRRLSNPDWYRVHWKHLKEYIS